MFPIPIQAPPTHLILSACRVDLDRREIRRRGSVWPLTPLEVDLIRYLADRAGETVLRRDIEADVWGICPSARSSAVPVAIRRLRAKIEPDPRHPASLITVRGLGWCLHTFTTQEQPRSRTAHRVIQAMLAWSSGNDEEAAAILRENVEGDEASCALLRTLRENLVERRDTPHPFRISA